ncbi:hypothetical protein [Microbispora sp. CA-102843]|uniref:hypothetical protein n=1 Tax=Microbispora sp. CA-102843 TaxID=3239952 RepID=UPI003D92FE71
MTRYRKLPVEVEAHQWDGTADGATHIIDWILGSGSTANYTCSNPDRCSETDGDTPHSISIRTLEGTMRAELGDWIIKGVRGEFYPCKPDIFATTYELVRPMRLLQRLVVADAWLVAVLSALMLVDHAVDGELWWATAWSLILAGGVAVLIRKAVAVRAVKAATEAERRG